MNFLDDAANRVLDLAARSAAGEGITSLHILAALCHVIPEVRAFVERTEHASSAAAELRRLAARCEDTNAAEMVFRPDGKRTIEAALAEEDPPVSPRGLLLGLLSGNVEARVVLQALGLRRSDVAFRTS